MSTTSRFLEELLRRALMHAKASNRSFRDLVEDGLRIVLAAPESHDTYRLPDLSVGDPDAADPPVAYSWQEMRGTIYVERDRQR